MYSTFGECIHAYRKDHGLSMSDFAKLAGVSKAYVGMIERGSNYRTGKPIIPSLQKLSGIAKAMNVKLSELLRMVPNGLVDINSENEDDYLEMLDAGTPGVRQSSELYWSGVGESGKVSPKRDEAAEIAEIYRKLDDHGKGAVKAILEFEHAAVVADRRQSGGPSIKGKSRQRSDGFVECIVYDQPAAAGLGNYLDDPLHHVEQYPASVMPEGTDFGIRISGNSMAPDIRDGSTVFVQSRSAIAPGQIGIFLLNGEAFCKKLAVDRYEGTVRLVSLNPDYKDRIIEDCDVFSTMGLVLGSYPK